MTTYGIVYGTDAATLIIECTSLRDAWDRATAISIEHDADIVELEGSGPALDSDGDVIAPTHAPRRIVDSLYFQKSTQIRSER